MVEKEIVIFLTSIFILLAFFSFEAISREYPTATGEQVETDMDVPLEPDPSDSPESNRYIREMRGLNDEYEAGGLTRTEYIQRKREIDATSE